MKVTIEREGCIGCSLCTEICPEVFRMADDGLAEVYAELADETKDAVEEAEQSCPVAVIRIEE